jgi:hypothetical protein
VQGVFELEIGMDIELEVDALGAIGELQDDPRQRIGIPPVPAELVARARLSLNFASADPTDMAGVARCGGIETGLRRGHAVETRFTPP